MENIYDLREEQDETLKYVIENCSMITYLLESLKSGEVEKKRPNFLIPKRTLVVPCHICSFSSRCYVIISKFHLLSQEL